MSVSMALTKKRNLNPKIGQRLYQLLAKQSGFLAALKNFPTSVNPEQWSEVGAITEQSFFGTNTDGLSAGIQIEHWW
jgi:hypothetical protein